MLPSSLICLLAVGGTILDKPYPENWRQLLRCGPLLLVICVPLLPFALWRNRFTFDKEAGRVTHAWGYPFRWFGVREYELASFTDVSVNGVRPYWATPNGRVTPPMYGSFRNDGMRLYYHVALEGKQSVVVGELHTFAAAVRARRRLAAFLGFAVEPEPKRQAFLGANVHLYLVTAVMPIGMFAGLGLFFLTFKPLVAAVAAVGLKKVLELFVIASFGFWILATISALVGLVSLVPAACPSCGAKARLTWSDAIAPGLGAGRYRCEGCAADWPANS